MKQEHYEKVRTWFLEKTWRMALLRAGYRLLPLFVAGSYPICLFLCFRYRRELFWRALFVPAAMFLLVTAFRHWIDFPRPYEKEEIVPLIEKDKRGHSFPSRHAASAGMIAAAWMAYSHAAGALFLAVAALIGLSRVLAGVHYGKDVLAGGAFGFFPCGYFLYKHLTKTLFAGKLRVWPGRARKGTGEQFCAAPEPIAFGLLLKNKPQHGG